jgi:hypothetical protein
MGAQNDGHSTCPKKGKGWCRLTAGWLSTHTTWRGGLSRSLGDSTIILKLLGLGRRDDWPFSNSAPISVVKRKSICSQLFRTLLKSNFILISTPQRL